MERINSLTNNRVKLWTKLRDKRYRDDTGLFLVEGSHQVVAALNAKLVKEIISLEEIDYGEKVPRYLVNEDVMKKITALSSAPRIIAICFKKRDTEIGSKLLLLDSIQDPGNLGTIIRSAVAFGIDTIVIGQKTVDIYNEKVIRATEGMIFNVNIIINDLMVLITELKTHGYELYGTKVDGGVNLKKFVFNNKFALIIGNEGQGVSPQLLDQCDKNIFIPMAKKCESLNVAIATSIILYEMAGQNE